MCDCIDRYNEGLAKKNAALDIPNIVNMRTGEPVLPHRVQIQCYKLDTKKRGRIPWLAADFCPFCGEPYAAGAEPDDAD